jgi:hypothetical protein
MKQRGKKEVKPCSTCSGVGLCTVCHGEGEDGLPGGAIHICTNCHGTGNCPDCHGTGEAK